MGLGLTLGHDNFSKRSKIDMSSVFIGGGGWKILYPNVRNNDRIKHRYNTPPPRVCPGPVLWFQFHPWWTTSASAASCV